MNKAEIGVGLLIATGAAINGGVQANVDQSARENLSMRGSNSLHLADYAAPSVEDLLAQTSPEQGISLFPEGTEIVTSTGQVEYLPQFDALKSKSYWNQISVSVNFAVENFQSYLNQNPRLKIEKYRVVIPGVVSTDGKTIEPTPTPDDSDTKTSVFISFDGGGMLFLPDNTADVGWQALVSDNGSLKEAAPTADYVAPTGDGLIAFTGIMTGDPIEVAFGTPNAGRIEWKSVSPVVEVVPDSTVAEQITRDELKEIGDKYISGIKFQFEGREWQFVTDSDLPKRLNAQGTDLNVWTSQMKDAIYALDMGGYGNTKYTKAVVILEHDEAAFATAPAAMASEGFATLTTEFDDETGTITERIPYTKATIDMLNIFDGDTQKAIINEIYLYQLMFGRSTMGARDRTWDLFFKKMGLSASPPLYQIEQKFTGLAVR